eukprot:GHVR01034173.1.p2 GENE.GHVR01034173.1~~GHVR01034173.1.p2  ORF type:complete len:117 (-),score=2.46 GHVR01034173.1:2936-3286(-)
MSLLSTKKLTLTLPYQISKILNSNRKSPNIAINDLLDTIYGAFFGFLIGDIVGSHVAYLTNNILSIPSALLMNGGGTYNLGPGQATDQTEVMFSTAYGLIDSGEVYSFDIMTKKYL